MTLKGTPAGVSFAFNGRCHAVNFPLFVTVLHKEKTRGDVPPALIRLEKTYRTGTNEQTGRESDLSSVRFIRCVVVVVGSGCLRCVVDCLCCALDGLRCIVADSFIRSGSLCGLLLYDGGDTAPVHAR